MIRLAPNQPRIANSYPSSLGADPIQLKVNARRLWITRLFIAGFFALFYLDPASRHTMLQPRLVGAVALIFLGMLLPRYKTRPLIADRDGIEVGATGASERISWRDIGQIRLHRSFLNIPMVVVRLRPPDGRPFDPTHDPGRFDYQFGLFGPGPLPAFIDFLERARSGAAPGAGRVMRTPVPRTDEVSFAYSRRRLIGPGLVLLAVTVLVSIPWSHTSWIARPLLIALCLWVDYKFLRRHIRPNVLHLGSDGFRMDHAPQLGIVEWRDTVPFTLRTLRRSSDVIGLHFAPGSRRRALPFAKKYPEDFMVPHFGTGSRAEFVDWLNAYRCKALAGTGDRAARGLQRNVA